MLRMGWGLLALVLLQLGALQLVQAQQTGADFDHSATGFVLNAQHQNVRCETCHTKGQFKGTPTTCESCHGWNNPRASTVMPTTHIPTRNAPCESCHAPSMSQFQDALRVFSHVSVSAMSCLDCHSARNPHPGVRSNPNDPTHTRVLDNKTACGTCHTTIAFEGPKPPSNHIPTAAVACANCHVGADFRAMPSINAIHANAPSGSSNCAQCHSAAASVAFAMPGMTPALVGPPSNHVGMNGQSCEVCHVGAGSSLQLPVVDGARFSNSKFNHTGITSGCAACHGPGITGSSFAGISSIVVMPDSSSPGPNAHIPSSTNCETCHAGSMPSGQMAAIATSTVPGTGFQNPKPSSAMVHSGVTSNCSACHDTNAQWVGMTLYPMAGYTGFQTRPQGAAGQFNVADFNHPSSGDCSQCHTGISFDPANVKKPSNHIPTAPGAACAACHDMTNFSAMPTLANIHANAPSTSANCAQCHSSTNAALYSIPGVMPVIVSPPSNHIAMGTLGCENCHVGSNSSLNLPVQNGDNFGNSAFSHSGISTGCASCHGASVTTGTFFGVVPKTIASLSPAHVPTTLACETCHTNNVPSTLVPLTGASGSITTFAGAKFTHSGITSGCATCHGPTVNGNTFFGITQIVVMPASNVPGAASHLPTSTTCESCHAGSTPSGLIAGVATQTAPGSGFQNPAPTAAMIHSGVSGSCASCHDTNYVWMGMSKYPITTAAPYKGFQTRPQAAAGTFFVADTSHPQGECSNCHSSFDNFNGPSAPAIHIPYAAGVQCSVCHGDFSQLPSVTAIHANAPSTSANCAQCHSSANAANFNQNITVKIVAPPANHIAMGNLGCENCHVGSNSSLSLPVQTGANFGNSAFSHTGISTGCASCHGASVTTGTFYGVVPKTIASLTPAHVPTTLSCETCHAGSIPSTLIPFSGASGSMATFAGGKFSHSGITSGCATCHGPSVNGSTFYGITQIVTMPPSTAPGALSHLPTSTTCESCHAGSTPSGLIAGVATQSAPGTGFQLPAPTAAMIHSGVSGNCASCHDSNYVWLGMDRYPITTSAPYKGFQTRPQAVAGTFFVADATHPMGECSNCHSVSSFDGPSVPAIHIPYAAGALCSACHGDFSSLPTVTKIHANAPSTSANCAQCHSSANAATYNQNIRNRIVAPSATHIPMGALGCESCHVGAGSSMAATPVQDGARFAGSLFNHSGITSGCASCHGASVTNTTFDGVWPKTMASLSPMHVPTTAACETCHTNSVPTGLVPAAGMTTFAGGKFSHSGITSGCDTCHGPNITNSSFYGVTQIVVMPPSSTQGSGSHLPTSTQCESCHLGSTPTALVPAVAPRAAPGSGFLTPAPTASMIHAGVTGGCSSCHDSNYVWMSVGQYPITTAAPYKGFQTRPLAAAGAFNVADAAHPTAGDCSNCHGSFSDFTSPSKPSNHIPTSAACSTCHRGVDYSVMPTVADIHANVAATNCAQCHSDANAAVYNTMASMSPQIVSPPGDHIPMGTSGCESCHVGTGSSVASLPVPNGARFSGSLFNHSGTNVACSACHGKLVTASTFAGVAPRSVSGLVPEHVPVSNTIACDVCHTNGAPTGLVPSAGMKTFAGAKFSHSGITSGCETCHGPNVTGANFYGITQIVVMPSSTAPGANSHFPTSTTCENCHALSTPATLVPGVATRAAPGTGFKLPAPTAAMIHAGITGSCSNCHETPNVWMGADQYPITKAAPYKGFQTRPQTTAGTYYVSDASHPGTGDCSNCHGNFNDFTAPSMPAIHIPVAVSATCSACHGDFTALPTIAKIHANAPSTSANCAQCHSTANATNYNQNARRAIVAPPSNHIGMGNLGCESCHVGAGSSISATPVLDSARFSGSLFSHSGISSGCDSCHGASVTTGTFAGVLPKTIASLSPAHIPTTAACELCHTNSVPATLVPSAGMTTFASAKFSHNGITSGCATCHGPAVTGSTFYGVSQIVVMPAVSPTGASSHLPTTTTCESCHLGTTPTTLVPGVATRTAPGSLFLTPAPTAAQIHAGTTGACSTCHETNMVWMSMGQYPITTAAPYKGFQTRPQGTAGTFFVKDTTHPGTGECSNCHASMSDFTTSALPSNHIPIRTGAACTTCHTNVDFSVMPTVANIHANAPSSSTNCAQCHSAANAAIYNTMASMVPPIKTVPAKHVDMAALGCEGCHITSGGVTSSMTLPVQNGAVFSNSAYSHTGVTTGCSTCHGNAVTVGTFFGVTPKTMLGLAPVHVPSSQVCESCHTSVPAALIPLSGGTGANTFAGGKFSHNGIVNGCDTCHGAGITGSSFYGVTRIVVLPATSPAGSSAHIPSPINAQCEACHLGSTPTALVPAVAPTVALGSTAFKTPVPTGAMVHTSINGSCNTCHEKNLLWLGVNLYTRSPTTYTAGASYTGFNARPYSGGTGYSINDASHPTTGDCSACHGSTASFSVSAKPANHIPVNPAAACTACHTNITAANPDFSVMPSITNIHAYAPAPVTSNCASCHSAANAAIYALPSIGFSIKAPDTRHIPFGTTACEVCHVGTGSSMATAVVTNGALFSGSRYSHAGVTTGCATCHGPTITSSSFTGVSYIVVAPPTSPQGATSHIPYTAACEVCHAGSTPAGLATVTGSKPVPGSGFKLPAPTGVMIHAASTGYACKDCHEANYRWVSVDQYPISPTVVTAGANYKGFQTRPIAAATTYSVADQPHTVGGLATGDCSLCHSGTTAFTAAGKPAGHMPTTATATCATCHGADYSIATLGSLASLHTGISSTFVTYTAANIGTKTCSTCHTVGSGGISGTAPFTGCATQAACTSPPPLNTYQPMLKEAKGAHVPIGTLDCNGCHASVTSFAGTNMMPGQGNGTKMHNNATLGGVKCMDCHEFGLAWFGVNNLLTRVPSKHTTTSRKAPNDCSNCHNINGFRALLQPIMREALVSPDMARIRPNLQTGTPSRGTLGNAFDHTGVTPGQCKTCHNGKAASGMPARHLMVNTSCDTCHRATTWTPAQFSHNGISPSTCLACHNGMGASAKPPGHFMTARSCDSCHKMQGWAPVMYQHMSPQYRAAPDMLTCVSCHVTNGEIIPRQMRGLNRTKPIPVGP